MTTTIYSARKIITMNPMQPEATHVAVRDGRILGVGDLATLAQWGPHTLDTRFADMDRQRDLGELKLKISGCINACGHHHAGHIGILGVDRKGVENYQLTFGGSGAEDVSIGKIIGPGFDEDGVVDAVEKATEVYKTLREGDERFIDTYRRVGLEPFKEAIYG